MVDDTATTSDSPAKRARVASVNGQGQAASSELWKAKRFAVKFQPPCIFLEYEDAAQKRRVRQVKLTRVPVDVDVDRLTRKVIRSFPRQLDPGTIKHDQVRKLVVKLLESIQQQAQTANGSAERGQDIPAGSAVPSKVNAGIKALKVEPATSSGGPASAPTPRLTSCLSPHIPPTPAGPSGGLPASAQSVESTDRFSTSTFGGYNRESKESYILDDLDTALSELDKELEGGGSAPSTSSRNGHTPGDGVSRTGSFTGPHHGSVTSLMSLDCGGASTTGNTQSKLAAAADDGKKSRFGQEAEKLVLDVEIEGDVDLNRVTEVELHMAKLKMEEHFKKNQLKPGDPGYVYDKPVEFPPATESNDWDESGDEEDDEEEEDIRPMASKPAAKPGAGLHVEVNGDNDEDRNQTSNASSPESVPDDVSPNRVAIDTDSDLGLDLP